MRAKIRVRAVLLLALAITIAGSAAQAYSRLALEWSTFLGGISQDMGWALARAQDGTIHVICETYSFNFPVTPDAYDHTYNGVSDTGIMRISADGSELLYGSFLGGHNRDVGRVISFDESGNIYVAGATSSAGFPVTPGAPDTTYNGEHDAFLLKFDPTGRTLLFGTFLGGPRSEKVRELEVLGPDLVCLTGYTESLNFPTTPACFDESHNGGWDVFVTIIDIAARRITYSTLIGGSLDEEPWDLVVGPNGNLYLTGYTGSSDYPITPDAYDWFWSGHWDGFVTCINPRLTELVYSTFIGGSGYDRPWRLRLNENNEAVVCGQTSSANFPTTATAFDTSPNGEDDAFVLALNSTGTELVFSTVLGTSDVDEAQALAIDDHGWIIVAGTTWSNEFPVRGMVFDPTYNDNGDAYVSVFTRDGSGLLMSGYLGGSDYDEAYAVEVRGSSLLVLGLTHSADFPITGNEYDTTFAGPSEAFLTATTIESDYCDVMPTGGDVRLELEAPASLATGPLAVRLRLPAGGPVVLEMFDCTGRLEERLFSGWLAAGDHSLRLERDRHPAGVYLLALRSPAVRRSCKIACR